MTSHKQDTEVVRTALQIARKMQDALLSGCPMDHSFPKDIQRDLARLRELCADKEVEE
jgi:hypothetical protein